MKNERFLWRFLLVAFIFLAGCVAPQTTLHFGGGGEGLDVYADGELLGQTPLRVSADAVCGGRVPCELVLIPKTGEPVRLVMDRWDRIARPGIRQKSDTETNGFGGYFFIATGPAHMRRNPPIPAPVLVRAEEDGGRWLTGF